MEEVAGVWQNVRRPDPTFVFTTLSEFAKRVRNRLSPTTPLALSEFPLLYRGRRQTVYRRAVQSLLHQDVTRADSRVKAFVKCEKINFEEKTDPDPRIIQPRDPRYNVCVGVYLKPLEHKLYAAIDQIFGYRCVMKGLNSVERGAALREAWDAFVDPVAIDLDAARFDRHVSVPILEWEHGVYKSAYIAEDRENLARLLAMQVDYEVVSYLPDGRVKLRLRGGRGSGDMNTACGNVLIMCGALWSYLRGVRYRLCDDGDDSVLILERRDLHFLNGIVGYFERLGFVLKVGAVVDVFEKITFCQSQPVWDGGGYRLVRDPRVSIKKDSISMMPLTPESTCRRWMAAVGECGLALAGTMPVLSEYYQWFLRNGLPGQEIDHPSLESGMTRLAFGIQKRVAEPSERTRVSFWLAFGWDSTTQRNLEEAYRNLPFSSRVAGLPIADPATLQYRLTATRA